MKASDFEFTVPVLVVGGGACGASAALAAHDAGASVLLIERDAVPAGTTGMSQGLVCAAGTASQRVHGIEDDAETLYRDILAKTKGQTDPILARTIAKESGPTLDWLVTEHDLPWELDLRFKPSYGHSRTRVHGWPGHTGIDMVQLMHARLASAQIDVLTEARLVEIIKDEQGQAVGVTIERPDSSQEQIGCNALVLAAGGFASNHSMIARYMPEASNARCNGHEGNRGETIVSALALGAAVGDMGAYQGYGMLADPQGIPVPPGFIVEGGVLVNTLGQRFVQEAEDISGMVHAVLAQPNGMAWVIADADIEQRCTYMLETQELRALGAMREADTLMELAACIGVDINHLSASLQEAWQSKKSGLSDSLGRDWSQSTPPQGPYRAIKVCGAVFHTQGGLQIDANARVLQTDGTGIANLFAGGGNARSVSGPSCWGYLPAMGLCTAVTFGRLAGRSAAEHFLMTTTERNYEFNY